jgi:4-hydroxy-2-oxoheptanedioate aldolase
MSKLASPLGLAARMRAGDTILTAWCTLPHPLIVESLARAGFNAVTFDFQHGAFTFDGLINCISAAAANGMMVSVKMAYGDPAFASRVLDAGAGGVIMPSVNNIADARTLALATKFPPIGTRCWGPQTALYYARLDRNGYLHYANDLTVSLAMIESAEGYEQVEKIMTTPGIDGVLVGPYDLSISLSRGRYVDPNAPAVVAALEKVLVLALRHGKVAGIFANSPELARDHARRGYRFIAVGTDLGFLRAAARAALDDASAEPEIAVPSLRDLQTV